MFLKPAFDFSILEIRHAWRLGTIAVTSYLLAMFILHLQSPQWVMLTAIVCSQANFGSTMRKSKQRLTGTVLGATLGVLVEYLFSDHNFFLAALFFISVLIALQFVARSYTVYTAFFTFGFILMMFFMPAVGYNVAIVRMEDVIIGGLIGTLGAFVLWPDFASKMFAADIVVVVSDMQMLFNSTIEWIANQIDFETVIQRKIQSFDSNQKARNRISEIYHEFGLLRYPAKKYEKFVISQERIYYTLALIIQSVRYEKELHHPENSLHLFIKKMIEIQKKYSEITYKIPNISDKVKIIPNNLNTNFLANKTEESPEFNQHLFLYLDKLNFELREMIRIVNDMIEYES